MQLLHQLVSERDPSSLFPKKTWILPLLSMDAEASFNHRLQLVEQAIEELRKGQSNIQQSLVELTNLFTRFHVQPLEEAIQPPRNPIAANQERQEKPINPVVNQELLRNQPIHIHNNRLYGNNVLGNFLNDSDSFDEDNLLNIHQEPQQRFGLRPYFQEDQEIRMKVDLPTFNGRMDVEKFLDWIKNVEIFFDYANTPEHKKVRLVALKLQGGASAWWDQLQNNRRLFGKQSKD